MPPLREPVSSALIALAPSGADPDAVPFAVRAVLDQLDAAGWIVESKRDEGAVTTLFLSAAASGDAQIDIPGQALVSLKVRADISAGRPALVVERGVDAAGAYVEVRNFVLLARIESAAFHPQSGGVGEIEARLAGSLQVGPSWGLSYTATAELPAGSFEFEGGRVRHAGVTVSLEVDAGNFAATMRFAEPEVDAPPFRARLDEPVEATLTREAAGSEASYVLTLALGTQRVGCLGQVTGAELEARGHEDAASHGFVLDSVKMECEALWERLPALLQLPSDFPVQLAGGTKVGTVLTWQPHLSCPGHPQQSGQATAAYTFRAELAAALPDVDFLWEPIPPALRPQLRNPRFTLCACFAAGANFPPEGAPRGALAGTFAGEAALCFEFRLLREPPPGDILRWVVRKPDGRPDPEGWIHASAAVRYATSAATFGDVRIENQLEALFDLSGASPSSPQVRVTLRGLRVEADAEGPSDAGRSFNGRISFDGVFSAALRSAANFRLFDPPPRLAELLRTAGEVQGGATLGTTLRSDALLLSLKGIPSEVKRLSGGKPLPIDGEISTFKVELELPPINAAAAGDRATVRPRAFEVALDNVVVLDGLLGSCRDAALQLLPAERGVEIRGEGGEVAIGGGRIGYSGLALNLRLTPDGFEGAGSVRDLSIKLPPLEVERAAEAGIELRLKARPEGPHPSEALEVVFSVARVPLGSLGQLADARLKLTLTRADSAEDFALRSVELEGDVAWDGLAGVAGLTERFPFGPPKDGRARAKVTWTGITQRPPSPTIGLEITASLAETSPAWRPVAELDWPRVSAATFRLKSSYQSAALFPTSPAAGALRGEATVEFDVDDLPPLPPLPGLKFSKTPAGAKLHVVLTVRLREESSAFQMLFVETADAKAVASVEMNLPALPLKSTNGAGTEQSPVRVTLAGVSMRVTPEGVELGFRGKAKFAPIMPDSYPLSSQLRDLLTKTLRLTAQAQLDLRLRRDAGGLKAADAALVCGFQNAVLSVDGVVAVEVESLKLLADFEEPEAASLEVNLRQPTGASGEFTLPGGLRLATFGTLRRAAVVFEMDGSQPRLACRGTWEAGTLTPASGVRFSYAELRFNAELLGSQGFRGGGTFVTLTADVGKARFALSLAEVEEITFRNGFKRFAFGAEVNFEDLKSLFSLPPDFPYLSQLLDGGTRIGFRVSCEAANDGGFKAALGVDARAEALAKLPFIPADFQPQVRDARLTLRTEFAVTGPESEISGGVRAVLAMEVLGLPVRLPAEIEKAVRVRIGEAQGEADAGLPWLGVEVTIAASTSESEKEEGKSEKGEGKLEVRVLPRVFAEFDLPGLPQPRPPVEIELETVKLSAAGGQGDGGGAEGAATLEVKGKFTLRAIHPPTSVPFSHQLEQFLRDVRDVRGEATLTASMYKQGDKQAASLALDCGLADAGIEANVFELLRGISSGAVGDDGATGSALGQPTFRFGLKSFQLLLQTPRADRPEQEAAAVATEVAFGFGPMDDVSLRLRLSNRALEVKLDGVRIPLVVPEFPFRAEDLEKIKEDPAKTDVENSLEWRLQVGRLLNEKNKVQRRVRRLESEVEALRVKLRDEPLDIPARDAAKRALTRKRQELSVATGDLFSATVRHGLILSMKQVRDRLTTSEGRQRYRMWLDLVANAFEMRRGLPTLRLGGPLWQTGACDLVFDSAGIRIPFSDPRNSSVEGTAHLEFPEGHVLAPLNSFRMSLGLSAETVYVAGEIRPDTPEGVAAQSTSAVTIPALGRYEEGKILPGKISIGYGYRQSSIDIDAAGGIKFPPTLVEDADTSEHIGAGIRLPLKAEGALKLVLIRMPHPIYVVPLFLFKVDLRADFSPGLTDTKTCEPFWDGLQLVVPGVIRIGLKKFSFNPFLITAVAPNFQFGGDLMLGDARNGLTVVVDELYDILFIHCIPYVFTPFPFLTGPEWPFFENLCFNVRVAGFGVNFNVQRPLPGVSPMAILELLGLLSEASLRIDPQGELANTFRLTIRDAHFTLPEELWPLFPKVAQKVLRDTTNVTINLATFLPVAGQIFELVKGVVTRVADKGGRISEAVRELQHTPPKIPVGELLGALPPELRKFRLGASFAGFEAETVIALINRADAADEFRRRGEQSTGTLVGLTPRLMDMKNPQRFEVQLGEYKEEDLGGLKGFDPLRSYAASRREKNLFAGREFAVFSEQDLDALMSPREGQEGRPISAGANGVVVVGARVMLLDGQRYRFLGFIFEDGYFSFTSRAYRRRYLRVSIKGLPAPPLPLRINGRLTLTGRARRDGSYAGVTAEVTATWEDVFKDILTLRLGKEAPARLQLRSDGRFAIKGDVEADFFNGAAVLKGKADVTQDYCRLEGSFSYSAPAQAKPPLIFLSVNGKGEVGPGEHFEFVGDAGLKIGGVPLGDVRARVSETGAEVEGSLSVKGGQWLAGTVPIPCGLDAVLKGRIVLRNKRYAEFTLTGAGKLDVSGLGLVIEGSITISAAAGRLTTVVEGAMTWNVMRQDPASPVSEQLWTKARVELSGGTVKVSGELSCAALLAPSPVREVSYLSPYVLANLAGDFTFSPAAEGPGLAALSLRAEAILGVSPPQTAAPHERQILPVAAGSFQANFPSARYPQSRFRLVNVRGFGILTPEQLIREFTIKEITIKKLRPAGGSSGEPPDIQVSPTKPSEEHREITPLFLRLWWKGGTPPTMPSGGSAGSPPDLQAEYKAGYTGVLGLWWNPGTPPTMPSGGSEGALPDLKASATKPSDEYGELTPPSPPRLWWKDGKWPTLPTRLEEEGGELVSFPLPQLPPPRDPREVFKNTIEFGVDLVWVPDGYFKFEITL